MFLKHFYVSHFFTNTFFFSVSICESQFEYDPFSYLEKNSYAWNLHSSLCIFPCQVENHSWRLPMTYISFHLPTVNSLFLSHSIKSIVYHSWSFPTLWQLRQPQRCVIWFLFKKRMVVQLQGVKVTDSLQLFAPSVHALIEWSLVNNWDRA